MMLFSRKRLFSDILSGPPSWVSGSYLQVLGSIAPGSRVGLPLPAPPQAPVFEPGTPHGGAWPPPHTLRVLNTSLSKDAVGPAPCFSVLVARETGLPGNCQPVLRYLENGL